MRLVELNQISYGDLKNLTLPSFAVSEIRHEGIREFGGGIWNMQPYVSEFRDTLFDPLGPLIDRILQGELWLVQDGPFFPAILEINTKDDEGRPIGGGHIQATLNPQLNLLQSSHLEQVVRNMLQPFGVSNDITPPETTAAPKPKTEPKFELVKARWDKKSFNTEADIISGWIQVRNQKGGETVTIEIFGSEAPNQILNTQDITLNQTNKRYDFQWTDMEDSIEIEEQNMGDLQFKAVSSSGEEWSDVADVYQPVMVETPYHPKLLPTLTQPGLAEVLYPIKYQDDAWVYNCRSSQSYKVEDLSVTYASKQGLHILKLNTSKKGFNVHLKGPWQEPVTWLLIQMLNGEKSTLQQGETKVKEGQHAIPVNMESEEGSVLQLKLNHPDGQEVISTSFEME